MVHKVYRCAWKSMPGPRTPLARCMRWYFPRVHLVGVRMPLRCLLGEKNARLPHSQKVYWWPRKWEFQAGTHVTHRLDSPRISTPPSPCCISQFLTPTIDWLEISYRRCQQWTGWFAQVLNYRRCLSQIHQQQTSSQYATFWPVHWDTPQDHRRNCLNSLWRRTEPTPTCQQYSIQLSTSFVQYANANLEFFAKKVIAAACYTHHLRASACWQPFAPYYLRSLALGPGTADDYFVYVVRDTTKQMVKYFVVDEHQRRHLSLAISRTAVDFYAPGIYSSLTSSTTNKPRMRCTGAPFICCSKAWKPGTC